MALCLFDKALYCPANLKSNQLMAAKSSDDTNILNCFIRFSHLSRLS